MPREVIEKFLVYKFDELPEDVQEKVIANNRESAWETIDSDDLKYQFEQYLEERGLPTETIEFSLSYSQGDGVAFYGGMDRDDCEKFMEFYDESDLRKLIGELGGITASIGAIHGTRYAHAHTMEIKWVELYDDELEGTDDLLNDFHTFLQEKIVEVSNELESMGYKEIEWLTSEERIKERIQEKDCEFTEDGKIYQ